VSNNGFENAQKMLAKIGPIVGIVVIVGVLSVAGLSRIGCKNQHVAAGHAGYVKSKPIFGEAKFVRVIPGPSSTGWVWRQEVTSIDVRARTFSEENKIISKEQLELHFRAHARVRLKPELVRELVEKWGGADWYNLNVKEQFASAVREQVQVLNSFEVKDKIDDISAAVMAKMKISYKGSPIEFLSVDIGNIEYPQVVVSSVIEKFVTDQDNERKEIELKIAQKEIEIGVSRARGTRDAQTIIRTTLDPMYLQFEALEAIEQLAGSQNTTFLVMPFSKNGSSPVIFSLK
jgi:hypothetical protein